MLIFERLLLHNLVASILAAVIHKQNLIIRHAQVWYDAFRLPQNLVDVRQFIIHGEKNR